MLRASAVLALLVAVLTPTCAFADGAFFSIRQDLAEPNQKAVLFREGGQETLILQVRYDGNATDFGWVVPVPTRPKLSAGSIRLFAELSALTMPWGMAGKKPKGAGGARGGGEGVVEVERLQVGPYDTTVLAASDAGALAGWLREHGYRLPPNADPVLRSYVDRGWHYVAMRIDTTRLQRELLARMRHVEPSVTSFGDAPAKIAAKVMRLADADTPKHKPAISKQLAEVRALLEDLPPAYPGNGLDVASMLGSAYHDYVDGAPRRREAGLVVEAEAEAWLECPVSGRALRAAARAVGLRGKDRAGIARTLATRTSDDLRANVPYSRSVLGRLHASLGRRDAQACESLSNEATAYEWRRSFRARRDRTPLPSREEVEKVNEEFLRVGGPLERAMRSQYTRNALDGLVSSFGVNQLYEFISRSVQRAPEAVATALHTGVLAPLRFDFASPRLIYPLRISSLSTGESLVQLYVLSNHRAEAEGLAPRADYGRLFQAKWAGSLSAQNRLRYRELSALAAPTRGYVTELQARLTPEMMASDVLLRASPTDEPVVVRRPGGWAPVR
jgi:hypothetical protein